MDPILICCPYCIEPLGTRSEPDARFDLPARCYHCNADLGRDAPLEMHRSAYERMARCACERCGTEVAKLAVRCVECRQRLARTCETFGSLAAANGSRVLFVDRPHATLLDLGAFPPTRARRFATVWQHGAALSNAGTVALASDEVRLIGANDSGPRSIGAPECCVPGNVGFIDETLVVFPDVKSDLDVFRPWRWDGARWSDLTALPAGVG